MCNNDLAWYCARTKPKHEHIAAANIRKNLELEVFNPRLRLEKATRRGPVNVVEPLFPCYLFVRMALARDLNGVQFTNGICNMVHFGVRIPLVEDSVIEELQECFESGEPMEVKDQICPADEVSVVEGAFAGMSAVVLRVMPARRRVQILLDILGRPTPVEVDRVSLTLAAGRIACSVPLLAANVSMDPAVLLDRPN